MIEVKHLVKEFTLGERVFRAVDDVSFSVKKGEIYGIIGLSGAGKSTLVRCLNRLEEPTSGTIRIDGVDLLGLSKKELLEERKEIGMIFQAFHLFHQKTVYENVAYPLEIRRTPKEQIKSRVEELLDFVDLLPRKDAYPAALSGGQKQRVAIARALATNPKILLSDEGTSALDPANTKQILALLRRAVDTFGMTVVMITHQMEVAKEICDRVAVMEAGRIIEENTVEELFRAPKTERAKSFVADLRTTPEEILVDGNEFQGKVLRLSYDGTTVGAPILSHLVRTYDVDVNIIAGNINRIGTEHMGVMVVELLGESENIYRAMADLERRGLRPEVME